MACALEVHQFPATAWLVAAHHSSAAVPPLDHVMLFGFVSTCSAALFYLRRRESRTAMVTFAVSLAATGVYGFLEGAWPLAILETAWALKAAGHGLLIGSANKRARRKWRLRPGVVIDLESRQSRYREIFGSN